MPIIPLLDFEKIGGVVLNASKKQEKDNLVRHIIVFVIAVIVRTW